MTKWNLQYFPRASNLAPRAKERGFLLVTFLATTGLLSILVFSMAFVSFQESTAAQRQAVELKAYYLSEGSIDHFVHKIRQAVGQPGDLPDVTSPDDTDIPTPLWPSYDAALGQVTKATQARVSPTLRKFVLEAETPEIKDPVTGKLLKPKGEQTIVAYVRDQMDPFIFDTLIYAPYFWSDRVMLTGADADGPQPEGQPETGRGNIYVSDQWGDFTHPPIPPDLPQPVYVNQGYQSNFLNTRVIEKPSVFPAPRFRMKGPSGLINRAKGQFQRDAVTGDYLCRNIEVDCQAETDAARDNRETNYYDHTRVNFVNMGAEQLPTQFWYPQFSEAAVTVSEVRNPLPPYNVITPEHTETVINPQTGRPVLVPKLPTEYTSNDEANIVVLDFTTIAGPSGIGHSGKSAKPPDPPKDGEAVLAPVGQQLMGGFWSVLQPVSATHVYDSGSHGYLSFKVTEDQAVLNTIIYQHHHDADVDLYSWDKLMQSRYDFTGAIWGGRMTNIWAPDLSGAGPPTVTYSATYADTIKHMHLPAEPQVLAVYTPAPVPE